MKKNIYALFMAMSMLVGLSACNSGSSGSSNGTVTATAVGNCSAGQIYTTQYGCLPQGNCPAGEGMYTSGATTQCVVGTTSTCGTTNGYNPYNPYGTSNPYGSTCTGTTGYGTYPGYNPYGGGSYYGGATGYGYGNVCPAGYYHYPPYCMNQWGAWYYIGY